MKKLLTLILTLALFSPLFAQIAPRDYSPQEYLYMKKVVSYDKMKRGGIGLAVGGTLITGLGTFLLADYVNKTINPQVILQAIRQCENTLINKRAEMQEEQEEARRKVEKELASKGLLGVNGWLKYCQRRGITDQPNPMQGFIKDMRKKQFNVK